MEIGERIKTLRNWQNMSMSALAVKTGCTHAAISQYESGKRIPSLSHFKALCMALGVQYAVLLDGDSTSHTRGNCKGCMCDDGEEHMECCECRDYDKYSTK